MGSEASVKHLVLPRLLFTAALLLAARAAAAQNLPVTVSVNGNVAVAEIGAPLNPLAELTLTFDDASNLSASSLGISAQLVDINAPALLSRLPAPSLTRLENALPLMVTIQPPASGGLSFRRSGRFELHTHALTYAVGSSFRVFKAPIGGAFRDTTEQIAPGSVRARSRYGGFSQFLVLTDLRPTSDVIHEKTGTLRARVATLSPSEQPAFIALLDAVESSLDNGDYATALQASNDIGTRAQARAGSGLSDEWRADDGDSPTENQAGHLMAEAASLGFSIAYLRDFGQ